MIDKWSDEFANEVRAAVVDLVQSREEACKSRRELAFKTGRLPVYMDASGAIVLSDMGELFSYDHDTGDMVVLSSRSNWAITALIMLSRDYPSLGELRPFRPEGASDCPACGGMGKLETCNVYCQACGGAGWLPDT